MGILKRAIHLVACAVFLAPALALADYPEKPVRLVVPFPPGSAADIMGRIYADKLKAQLGQPVVIDNKPGATGAIGAEAVAKSAPDGYSILLNSSAMLINPWIVKQSFNALKDLTPIVRLAETAFVVVVDAKFPVQNFEQFIALAKQQPGKLSCATYGIGSPPHLSLELLKQAAGVDILHVPYKGSSTALPDLKSTQLSCVFGLPIEVDEFVKAGIVRALAVTSPAAMSQFPNAEPFGRRYPSATVVGWQAIFAPSATPKPVLDKLRVEWARLLGNPEVQQKIREAGYQPSAQSLDAFAGEMASDHEKFGKVVKAVGIRID